jgi:hypothetical protein
MKKYNSSRVNYFACPPCILSFPGPPETLSLAISLISRALLRTFEGRVLWILVN